MSDDALQVTDQYYKEYDEHERYVSKGRVNGPIYNGGRMLLNIGRSEIEVDRSTLEDLVVVANAGVELMGRDRV